MTVSSAGWGLIEDVAVEGAYQANSNAQSSPGSFLAVGVVAVSKIWFKSRALAFSQVGVF
jgi:hypothetical protein